jgi:vitamin B12 transporter
MGAVMQFLPFFTRILAVSTATGALAIGLSAPAHAQAYQDLPGVVIESAGLAPAEGEKTGSAFSVITGEELEKRQIRHAADALREIPGVAVNQSGGAGAYAQVRIRGAESNHLVVRIDGVEVNDVNSGDFDFATLLTADIERIEVLRGPQSGVYGSNALAGVVNIVTKKGTGPARVSVSTEVGSMNTHAATASASGGSDKGYLSVTASGRETDGYNLSRSGTEKDGSDQKTIFTRAGIMPVENFRIDGMFRYQTNKTEFDSDLFDWTTFSSDGLLDDVTGLTAQREQMLGSLTATLDLFNKHWQQKVFADHFQDDYLNHDPVWGNFSNAAERRHWGYQSSVNFETPAFLAAKHVLTGLVEQREEDFNVSTSAGRYERSQTGYAAEYRGEFLDRLFLTGNVRRDVNDTFDDATTYRLSAAYLLKGTGTRFHTSYGKGIKNPTFNEQFGYFAPPPAFYGNPNLTPEQSIGWDAGVEQKLWRDKLVLDVTYFDADLTDQIANGYLDVNGDGALEKTMVNLDGKSQRRGVEVALTARQSTALP